MEMFCSLLYQIGKHTISNYSLKPNLTVNDFAKMY